MRLTRGKLKVTKEWDEWQQSEFTILDQYKEQGLFGVPVSATYKDSIFNLVWTYVVKELDKHNKLGCQLLSNNSKITVITVFWTSNFGYCLFFRRVTMKIGNRNQQVRPK